RFEQVRKRVLGAKTSQAPGGNVADGSVRSPERRLQSLDGIGTACFEQRIRCSMPHAGTAVPDIRSNGLTGALLPQRTKGTQGIERNLQGGPIGQQAFHVRSEFPGLLWCSLDQI